MLWKHLGLSLLAVVGLMAFVVSCGKDTPFAADTYVGTWNGTWTNTTFSSSGAAKVIVAKNTSRAAGDLTFSFDLDGSVFGGANPPSEDFKSTVGATSATLTAKTSSVYGAVTGSMNGDGSLSGGGTFTSGNITKYDVTGTWSATKIDATVTITFASGTPATAKSTIAMTKQ